MIRRVRPVEPPDLMTREQVAAYFGVRPGRVRRWELRGVLTPVQTAAGERRYMTEEVQALAALYGQ
ncbi:MerR family transcriptional regulator [Streptomyces sp. KK5PA1]|uniref:MerR family transcriptional regulator n=2 Tax=Actinacidiphila acididurans TaxID=2784346 RepID=A0ABS2TMH2_9ACTN|nr:MerR family transcriptional regulator [Actinacidiphila acididurans]